jgi:hypothetical protein
MVSLTGFNPAVLVWWANVGGGVYAGGMTSVKMTTAPTKFGPDVRVRFLDLVRAGHGRHTACRAVGVSPDTFRRFYRADEEFRQAVADAEEEACEPIEAKLYEAAKEGEPWAVKEWLTKRNRARWGETAHKIEVEVTGQVELTAGPPVARVAELARMLEERRQVLAEGGAGVLDMTEGPDGVYATLPGPSVEPAELTARVPGPHED